MASYYVSTKVNNGINLDDVTTSDLEAVTPDMLYAFRQIVSDLATARTTGTDKADQFDDYHRVAFYAVMMAQRLGVPYGHVETEDEEGEDND